MGDAVRIIGIIAGLVLAGLVLWKGIPLNIAGMQVNPVRTDVVAVSGIDSAQLIKEDASQRTILLVPRSETGKSRFSACSEPPPDVAINLIQSLNASLDALAKRGSDLEASIAAKMTSDLKSTAEQIFQRSQGIQLLRDTMFRLCEALQNGVIEKDDYRVLIQNLITTANFIIPFEQCTGMARANQGQIASEILDKLLNSCLSAATSFTELLQRAAGNLKPYYLPVVPAQNPSRDREPDISQGPVVGPPAVGNHDCGAVSEHPERPALVRICRPLGTRPKRLHK
jgi:hypothetical protein